MERLSRLVVFLLASVGLFACGSAQFEGGGNKQSPAPPRPVNVATVTQPVPNTSNAAMNNSNVNPNITSTPATSLPNSITPPSSNPTVQKKGSFTVWAEPPSPALGESYYIHILVDLPSNVSNYQLSDLSGSIAGTDSWQQTISQNPEGASAGMPPMQLPAPQFTFNSGAAEAVFFVPGAHLPTTQDTINIHSSGLNETEYMTVNFVGSGGGNDGGFWGTVGNWI